MKKCKKVIFGSIWKKLIFYSFDLRGVFWELQKSVRFMEKAISGKIVSDFQIFKRSLRTLKIDIVFPSKSVVKFAVHKSYFD